MTVDDLTHIDARGHARMVDVTGKAETRRYATARCTVTLSSTALASVARIQETDPLAEARVAAIMAAKRTPDFIPLCHPLLIGDVTVDFVVGTDRIDIEARVETWGRTGVEIEALTACAAAALVVYDMGRELDPMTAIEDLAVWEKRGGRSGTWQRDAAASDSTYG
jgi:cyclic pyranopterin phosphate synthase